MGNSISRIFAIKHLVMNNGYCNMNTRCESSCPLYDNCENMRLDESIPDNDAFIAARYKFARLELNCYIFTEMINN